MRMLSIYRIAFLRLLFYSIAGTVMFITINFIFQIYYDYPEEYSISQHIGTIILTAILTEGLLLIHAGTVKRGINANLGFKQIFSYSLIYLAFITSTVTGFSILIMLIFASDDQVVITVFDIASINLVAILYSSSIVLALNLYHSNRNLKDSMLKMESYKKERAEAKFHAMKMQLSPHFLFNTLNTLYGIIDKNQRAAKEYLMIISDIYRYVLKNENTDVIELEKELNFVRDYAFLIGKRFNNAFELHIDIPENLHYKFIPPLTMQILIENALKHNMMDAKNKLLISITSENENELSIKNNIIIRNTALKTTGLGLQNLNNRYKYLINQPISIEKRDPEFIVKIPLIDVESYESTNNRR